MIYKTLTELIGNTPLLELTGMERLWNTEASVFAKLEYFNPLGSVKDRAALYMIEAGEASGAIKPGTVIIEPTSGNTGIGLAYITAIKGYRLILTMPENMSLERRSLLAALGAEIVLTPAALGMQGAVDRAEALHQEIADSFIPDQFSNEANVEAHVKTTSQEILRDLEGNVDIFVAAVGTGGTLTGNGKVLKAHYPACQVVAVEPASSPLLSKGYTGPHKIQGIGPNFVPKILDLSLIDEIIPVTDDDAYTLCRQLAKTEGLLVGVSAGAALCACKALAARPENKGKRIVTILPDTGERYLSANLFSDPE